jgi:hypothetical protein
MHTQKGQESLKRLAWSDRSACFTDRRDALGAGCTQHSHDGTRSPIAACSVRMRTHPRVRSIAPTLPLCCARCAGGHCGACAGFPLGALNTSVCPLGSSKIGTSEACIFVVKAVSKAFDTSQRYSDRPSGCYKDIITGNFNFNDDPTGAASPTMQPLCAGAPTRHPARARARACVCVPVCLVCL